MTIEIPESVVEAALLAVREVALPHVTSCGEDGLPIAIECDVEVVGREAMRAALRAALAEMLEPVGRIKGVHGPDDFCCTREIGFIPMKDEAVFRIRGQ